jgi:hypothetical protein
MSLRVLIRPAACCGAVAFVLCALVLVGRKDRPATDRGGISNDGNLPAPSADAATIQKLCSHCHRFPTPAILPRDAWAGKVRMMAGMRGFGAGMRVPAIADVIAWYERQAPDLLSLASASELPDVQRAEWTSVPLDHPGRTVDCYTSNVCWHDMKGDGRFELLSADMRYGTVDLWDFRNSDAPVSRLVAEVPHPARIEPVDLDRDGLCDLLIANLGSFSAIDHNLGTVEWLRQRPDGTFERISLCVGLGRVADVRAADLDGDDDLDLVVAEFGWRATGKTLAFENLGEFPRPKFRRHVIDGHSGGIHAPLIDLNGDGRLDVVVLISQQYEMVATFLNEGDFRFSTREIFRGPHPAWGATGLDPADLDQDGDVDFLVTNGDTFDDGVLKPDHGVTWLENLGNMNFAPRTLVSLPGTHRALAIDADGDGDLDILACSMAGETATKTDVAKHLPSLVLLEQVAPGQFAAVVLERGHCFHSTMAAHIDSRPGGLSVAVGNSYLTVVPGAPAPPRAAIWKRRADVPLESSLPSR